jgi:glycosidase
MQAWSNPDAKVRIDFPGGWPADSINKFTEKGRNTNENEAFSYIKKLSQFRKNCKAITQGKLIQFVPENGLYVYFRVHENQQIMVMMNTGKQETKIDMKRYQELLRDCSSGVDVITEKQLKSLNDISLKPYESRIIELFK